MRFLADAGISPKTVDFLRRNGHEAVHVRELGMQRAPDRLLVEMAQAEDRILLTFDLDFGEILALGVIAHPSVVIFRLSDERADSVNRRLEGVLSEQADALASGALILVEDARYRIRRLPIMRSNP
jgi:predicted nuclease of predicted toxin-antitoxin system